MNHDTEIDMVTLRAASNRACALMRVMSNPDRLLLLCQLSQGELCVQDLEEALDMHNWEGISRPSVRAVAEAIIEETRAIVDYHDCRVYILDGDELTDPVLLVVRSHHAVGRIHRHDLTSGAETGSVPMPSIFSRISGMASTFTISLCQRASASLGVPAGAAMPYQFTT